MTLDVYLGRKTTMQQQQQNKVAPDLPRTAAMDTFRWDSGGTSLGEWEHNNNAPDFDYYGVDVDAKYECINTVDLTWASSTEHQLKKQQKKRKSKLFILND